MNCLDTYAVVVLIYSDLTIAPPPPKRFRTNQAGSPAQANIDSAQLTKALEKVKGEVIRLDGYMKVRNTTCFTRIATCRDKATLLAVLSIVIQIKSVCTFLSHPDR